VPSLEYFKKQVFSRELRTYTIVEPGEFAYATIHLDEGSIGICPERCLISPMYTAFRVVSDAVLPEQRRIAEILDKVDALRAKRRTALAQLDALTQSIFLEMFGDPAMNPRRWPNVPMRTLFAASPIFGTMIPPTESGGNWLSLRVANIQDWQLDLTDQKFVDLPFAMVHRHGVHDGDVLLARAIGSREHLGKAVVVYPQGRKWAFDSHLMRLRFDRDKAEPQFIQHLLKSDGGRRLFLKAARRSAVQFNINTKEIAALRIPVPPISLQRAFVRCINFMQELKDTMAASQTELDAFFAAVQYRAFRSEL
jgi:type I restriction enzyme S subunit